MAKNNIPTFLQGKIRINKFTFLFLLVLALAHPAICQTYFTIGANNFSSITESYQLLPKDFSNAKVQVLITANELSAAGVVAGQLLTGLQWYVEVDNSSTTTLYDLYVSNTSQTFLPAGANFAGGSFSQIGSGLSDEGTYTGWHTATFTTPFNWDGTSNLIFQVCRTGTNSNSDKIALYSSTVNLTVSGYFNHDCTANKGEYSEQSRPYLQLISNNTPPPIQNTILLNSAQNTTNQILCVGTPITEVKYSTTGATGASFNGFPPGVTASFSSNTITIVGTPTTAGTFNYTVTLTGGSETGTANGTIIVNPIPLVEAIEGTQANYCTGTNTQFSNSTLSGVWSSSSVSVATINATGLMAALSPGNTTITYTVSQNNCINESSVNITIEALGEATISGPSFLCLGNTVQLQCNSTDGVWKSPDPSIATITATGSLNGIAPGTLSISYELANNGCTVSGSKEITVLPLPVVQLSSFSNFCKDDPNQQLNNGTPSGGTYQGVGISNTNIFSPNTAGTGTHPITYTYASEQGCTNSATRLLTVDACLSITENQLESFSVFPNPASKSFQIESSDINSIQLVDCQYKIIKTILEPKSMESITVEELADGIYYLILQSGKQKKITKLTVIH